MNNTLKTHFQKYNRLFIAFIFLAIAGILLFLGFNSVLSKGQVEYLYFAGGVLSITLSFTSFGIFMASIDMDLESGNPY